jgi:hypothetical protein
MSSENGLQILGLRVDRFLRVVSADLTNLPENGVVIVAGDNEQGKTSTLRAIWCALAGGRQVPEWPIHGDEAKGSIELSLGRAGMPEYKIVRTFTRKGTKLELRRADGGLVSEPQKVLDQLIGQLTFNPMAFRQMHPKTQQDTLLEITGLSKPLAELNEKRERLFGERRDVNRDLKMRIGERDAMVVPKDIPETRVDTGQLLDERHNLEQMRDSNRRIRDAQAERKRVLSVSNAREFEIEEDIRRLSTELLHMRESIKTQQEAIDKVEQAIAQLDEPDFTIIDARLRSADEDNRRFDESQRFAKACAAVTMLEDQSETLSHAIERIDNEKERLLRDADFPVEGLGFSEGGVTFNSLPFEQLAGAQQIQISMAVAMRLNPKVRVVLIDDASLLDRDHFAVIKQMAQEHGFQVWCGVIGNPDGANVVFEQGVAVAGSAVADD